MADPVEIKIGDKFSLDIPNGTILLTPSWRITVYNNQDNTAQTNMTFNVEVADKIGTVRSRSVFTLKFEPDDIVDSVEAS